MVPVQFLLQTETDIFLPFIQGRAEIPTGQIRNFTKYAIKVFVGRKGKNYNDMNLGILANVLIRDCAVGGCAKGTADTITKDTIDIVADVDD